MVKENVLLQSTVPTWILILSSVIISFTQVNIQQLGKYVAEREKLTVVASQTMTNL